MSPFQVRFTLGAEQDLLRLFDFLLQQDFAAAQRAQLAIAKALELLEIFPFSCRKAAAGPGGPFLRELIVPFRASGDVLLFEIENVRTVTILAVRHQREDDFQ